VTTPEDPAARCDCGAPAALAVGYRGESAVALQCVRCATADPRTPLFHRELAPAPPRQVAETGTGAT
jgi:hypothetical protein